MSFTIVGDVHLVRDGLHDVARDLATLVAQCRGQTVVFAGDLLDLAAETSRESAPRAIASVLGAHEGLRAVLAEHVASKGELLLVSGNHDAEVATAEGVRAFTDALGLTGADRDRVRATPWFARLGPEGALHVEHGHHFDPDNTYPHPLAPPDDAFAPLGTTLMRKFIAPMGIHALVHSNQGTPLQALARTLQLFGAKTPEIIARYMLSGAVQIVRAGRHYPRAHRDAHAAGEAALAGFLRETGIDLETLRELVSRGATPTLTSPRATLLRLYWDRLIPTGIASVAATSALLGGPGRRVAMGAAGVLLGSIVLGNNRYRGRVPASLVANGAHIAERTGARSVVFGHIHDPVAEGAYMNTGSFAFPTRGAEGRPYVVADATGAVSRGFFRPARA